MTDNAAPDTEQAPEFATLLLQHARGRSHDELSSALAVLVRAVLDTRKPGSVTYKITITPETNVEGVVKIKDEIKSTVPQLDRPASMWFADAATGALSQDHPHQQAMFTVTEGR